jgi:hypothetical protein
VPLVAASEATAQFGAAVTHAAHAPAMIGRKGAGAAQRSPKSAADVDASKSAANMAAAEAAPHVTAAEAAPDVAAAAKSASHMAAATSAAMATSATATPARQGIG